MTSSSQKFISLFVKVRELINTYDLINDDDTLKGCSVESRNDVSELINDIKIYLDKSEVEMIDNYMNTFNTFNMYNEYVSILKARIPMNYYHFLWLLCKKQIIKGFRLMIAKLTLFSMFLKQECLAKI